MPKTKSVPTALSQAALELDDAGVRLATTLIEKVARRVQQHETMAEQRVRLFLTLGSAGIAVLAILPRLGVTNDPAGGLITVVGLVILLLFGLETVHSLNWKQMDIRIEVRLENTLRSVLSERYSFVKSYSKIIEDANALRNKPSFLRRTIRGSLAEFMYISNSLLASGIVVNLAWGIGWCCTFVLSALVFVLLFVGQYFYSKWMRNIIPLEWV